MIGFKELLEEAVFAIEVQREQKVIHIRRFQFDTRNSDDVNAVKILDFMMDIANELRPMYQVNIQFKNMRSGGEVWIKGTLIDVMVFVNDSMAKSHIDFCNMIKCHPADTRTITCRGGQVYVAGS